MCIADFFLPQTSRDQLWANWGSFSDPQSGLGSYAWAAGTAPGRDDVTPFINVGLRTQGTANGLSLHDGMMVFITVLACNQADLCTTVSSDGIMIDGSPPVAVCDGKNDCL